MYDRRGVSHTAAPGVSSPRRQQPLVSRRCRYPTHEEHTWRATGVGDDVVHVSPDHPVSARRASNPRLVASASRVRAAHAMSVRACVCACVCVCVCVCVSVCLCATVDRLFQFRLPDCLMPRLQPWLESPPQATVLFAADRMRVVLYDDVGVRKLAVDLTEFVNASRILQRLAHTAMVCRGYCLLLLR